MKFINRIYYSLLFVLFFFLTPSTISFAQSRNNNPPKLGTIPNPLGSKSLNEFFSGILDVALQIGAIVAGLSIMYGGFMYATAQGDEEKIVKAYKTMTWSLVGTVILLGARVIMLAIQGTIADLQ